MTNLDINSYLNKYDGDVLYSTDWNGALSNVQTKVNEMIDNPSSLIGNAVDTANIKTGAVTTVKIQDGAVTQQKLKTIHLNITPYISDGERTISKENLEACFPEGTNFTSLWNYANSYKFIFDIDDTKTGKTLCYSADKSEAFPYGAGHQAAFYLTSVIGDREVKLRIHYNAGQGYTTGTENKIIVRVDLTKVAIENYMDGTTPLPFADVYKYTGYVCGELRSVNGMKVIKHPYMENQFFVFVGTSTGYVYDSSLSSNPTEAIKKAFIADGSVTNTKLANQSVTGNKIAYSTITTYKLKYLIFKLGYETQYEYLQAGNNHIIDGSTVNETLLRNILGGVYNQKQNNVYIKTLAECKDYIYNSLYTENAFVKINAAEEDMDNAIDSVTINPVRPNQDSYAISASMPGGVDIRITITFDLSDITWFNIRYNTAGSIADGSITESKIANNAITTNKVATGAITTNKIANNAVTTDKIANNAVNYTKLESYNFALGEDTTFDFFGNRIENMIDNQFTLTSSNASDLQVLAQMVELDTDATLQDVLNEWGNYQRAIVIVYNNYADSNSSFTSLPFGLDDCTVSGIIDNKWLVSINWPLFPTPGQLPPGESSFTVTIKIIDIVNDAEIDTANIKNGAVTSTKIANGAVGLTQIGGSGVSPVRIISYDDRTDFDIVAEAVDDSLAERYIVYIIKPMSDGDFETYTLVDVKNGANNIRKAVFTCNTYGTPPSNTVEYASGGLTKYIELTMNYTNNTVTSNYFEKEGGWVTVGYQAAGVTSDLVLDLIRRGLIVQLDIGGSYFPLVIASNNQVGFYAWDGNSLITLSGSTWDTTPL